MLQPDFVIFNDSAVVRGCELFDICYQQDEDTDEEKLDRDVERCLFEHQLMEYEVKKIGQFAAEVLTKNSSIMSRCEEPDFYDRKTALVKEHF